jgi:hypothetical protein
MHISPSNGPAFDLIRTDGLALLAGVVEDELLRSAVLRPALDNAETEVALRDVVRGLTGDPRLFRWRSHDVIDHLDARLCATVVVFTDTAEPQQVMRTAETPPPPPAAQAGTVLPPPKARSQQGANPSPAAKAFQDASDNGAATVCKGPCAACGKL